MTEYCHYAIEFTLLLIVLTLWVSRQSWRRSSKDLDDLCGEYMRDESEYERRMRALKKILYEVEEAARGGRDV